MLVAFQSTADQARRSRSPLGIRESHNIIALNNIFPN